MLLHCSIQPRHTPCMSVTLACRFLRPCCGSSISWWRSPSLRFSLHSSRRVHLGGTLRGMWSDSFSFFYSCPRRRHSRWKNWTKVGFSPNFWMKSRLISISTVFSVPTRTHAAYQLKALPHNIKKYFFRMKVDPLPPLYEHEGAIGEKTYQPGGSSHA